MHGYSRYKGKRGIFLMNRNRSNASEKFKKLEKGIKYLSQEEKKANN